MSQRRTEILEAYQRLGSQAEVARELGIAASTVHYHLSRAGSTAKPVHSGRIQPLGMETRAVPTSGVARYIVTSAQNNTRVNQRAWDSLMQLADHHEAELMVSRFTYNKNKFGKKSVKPGTDPTDEDLAELWYDPALEPFICDERVELAPGLVFCGEMNILPTAVNPLSGLETYTGTSSGIFPHAKVAMRSVATMQNEPTKFVYTTGTVTKMNYLQKKEGLKAEHHHAYAALMVEVDSDGDWFVRQLNADGKGRVYDLDLVASPDGVCESSGVEAVNWGDIHASRMGAQVEQQLWHEGGMMDVLRPRFQFLHDLFDMNSRSHHHRRDHHKNFEKHLRGQNTVEGEIIETAEFLHVAKRKWCRTVVVESNHDNHLERWLREADYRDDPVNATFFLEAQLEKYRSIEEQRPLHLLRWALERVSCPGNLEFLSEDDSFVICEDRKGGIECAMHGHLGINGARGTPVGLSRIGRRANTGHTHSAMIIDGLYVAGVTASLDLGYNKGPSSWSISHVITYRNGKRAIVTMRNGKWRAS